MASVRDTDMIQLRVIRWDGVLLRWGLGAAIFTVLAVAEGLQTFFLSMMIGPLMPGVPDISLSQCIFLSLVMWYLLGLFAPPTFWLVRRFPVEQPFWVRRLLILAAATAFFALVRVGIDVAVEPAIRDPSGRDGLVLRDRATGKLKPPEELFGIFFNARYLPYLLILWTYLGIGHAFEYYRKYREREIRNFQLEARLVKTQLQALQLQLQPHFLFNTLHAISALMHKDVELADRMLARLGDLLRITLDHAGTQEVPMQREVEFIKNYLEIEQARLGPRLKVNLEVDGEAMAALVPNLAWQPVVENAIRHAIAPRPEGGRIDIIARRQQDHLCLTVKDDGPGLRSAKGPIREGVGLANTRARLQQLYGAAHRFEIRQPPEGGLEVHLTIPYRRCDHDERNGAKNS